MNTPGLSTARWENKTFHYQRKTYNSVNEMIDVLRKKPFLTENELTWAAFDYDRNCNGGSNKKYADMLRRGLHKGIIKRIEAKVEGKRAKFFYYIPGQEDLEFGKQKNDSYIGSDQLDRYNADRERIKNIQPNKNKDKMDILFKEKKQIKLIINNIAETHNLYVNWEKGGLTDVEFVLALLKLATAHEVGKQGNVDADTSHIVNFQDRIDNLEPVEAEGQGSSNLSPLSGK